MQILAVATVNLFKKLGLLCQICMYTRHIVTNCKRHSCTKQWHCKGSDALPWGSDSG